jgi:crotonobetainyl-CoA:carnitine CoA-transferase CaiB-like acyl-CoA transferase
VANNQDRDEHMSGVLQGVKVIELAQYAYVPSAATVLAEWGADIIKIEHPVEGDRLRGLHPWGVPPGTGGFTYMWEVANRGKRSIGLDVGQPEGRDILLRLVEDADVFMTSFLPAARRRLAIDVEDLRVRNPQLIYARGSAQGVRGPEAEGGGFDTLTYWRRSGMAHAVVDEQPGSRPASMPGPAFGDLSSGLALAGGIVAALYSRERGQPPSVVDGSLMSTAMWAMQGYAVAARMVGRDRLREVPSSPFEQYYLTADDQWISLTGTGGDRHWPQLCDLVGEPELAKDPRFATVEARSLHIEECVEVLQLIFRRKTVAEWEIALKDYGTPWGRVRYAREALDDPQAEANGFVQDVDYGDGRSIRLVSAPVQFDGAPGHIRPAPEHAADTEQVLLELGFDWDALTSLKRSGTIT